MGHFKINEQDVFFILKDQLNDGSLCRLERYRDFDEGTYDIHLLILGQDITGFSAFR